MAKTLRTLRNACVALTALGLLLGPAPAFAKPPSANVEQARSRFQKGVQLFREGSYDAALAEFKKANQLAPSYRLLFNIAQVHYELHDYVEALKAFKRYLADGGDEIRSARRTQVQKEIEKLKGLVARVEVTTNVDGAQVLVDDVVVGTSPLAEPVLVNAGRCKITISKSGYGVRTRNIAVAGGEDVSVSIEIRVASDSGAQGKARTLGAQHDQEPSRAPLWISLAATSAFAIGTGVMGYMTYNAKRDFDSELENETTPARVDDARSKLVTFAAVTDGLAAATLIAGGFTLYFALDSDDPEDGTKTPKDAAKHRSFEHNAPKHSAPQFALTPTFGGLVAHGTF